MKTQIANFKFAKPQTTKTRACSRYALIQRDADTTWFILRNVQVRLAEARAAHPQPMVDGHHALGIIREEFHELEIEVFKRRLNREQFNDELLDLAAMCLRAIEDVGLAPREDGR